jgi:predicted house-cleaning noncanonical NTP pyrophosphatase (MazG superfamily)
MSNRTSVEIAVDKFIKHELDEHFGSLLKEVYSVYIESDANLETVASLDELMDHFIEEAARREEQIDDIAEEQRETHPSWI